MTRRPRRAAAAAAIVLSVSGLSACGFNAATDKIQADNAQGSTPKGGIIARALVLVKSPNAIAAALAGSLINEGDTADTLESITLTPDGVANAQPITIQPNIVLQPRTVQQFGAQGKAPITVPNAQNLKLGHFVDLLLHFKTAGDIKVQVETHKREGFYSDVLPATTTTTQAETRRAKATKSGSTTRTSTGNVSTTPTDEKAGTNPADAGSLSTGEAVTAGDGAAVTKSSVTTAPSAKKAATRAAKRAAKREAARAERAAEAAKTPATAAAPAAAPGTAPMAEAPHSGH